MFGLINIGATCWFNSIVQALLSCPRVLEVCRNSNIRLNQLFYELSQNIQPYANPQIIYEQFIKNYELGDRQEDTQEGIIALLDALGPNVEALFDHTVKVKKSCHDCKNIIYTNDENYYFLINDEDIKSHILKNYEELTDYKCDNCGNKTHTQKRKLIYAPRIIMVVFNQYGKKSHRDFPLSIDIPSKHNKILTYNIVAQIHHRGNTASGHYWATVKREKIYDVNDHHFSESVFAPAATTYMLLYCQS